MSWSCLENVAQLAKQREKLQQSKVCTLGTHYAMDTTCCVEARVENNLPVPGINQITGLVEQWLLMH